MCFYCFYRGNSLRKRRFYFLLLKWLSNFLLMISNPSTCSCNPDISQNWSLVHHRLLFEVESMWSSYSDTSCMCTIQHSPLHYIMREFEDQKKNEKTRYLTNRKSSCPRLLVKFSFFLEITIDSLSISNNPKIKCK